jgi:hypothetical protein
MQRLYYWRDHLRPNPRQHGFIAGNIQRRGKVEQSRYSDADLRG